MLSIISIDTEYSSFNVEKGDLIQLGAVAIVNGEKFTFNENARPINRNAWSKEAEKVHGITWNKAQTFQPISEMAKKFAAFLDQFDTVFTPIGWNCNNDNKYIKKLIRKHLMQNDYYHKIRPEWIDVLKMARKSLNLNKYTLSSVAKYFHLEFDAHDALSDADVTLQIYDLLKAKAQNHIQQSVNTKMTAVEKRKKYLDMKYIQIGDGTVYITEHATKDKEALRVILTELWNLYGD